MNWNQLFDEIRDFFVGLWDVTNATARRSLRWAIRILVLAALVLAITTATGSQGVIPWILLPIGLLPIAIFLIQPIVIGVGVATNADAHRVWRFTALGSGLTIFVGLLMWVWQFAMAQGNPFEAKATATIAICDAALGATWLLASLFPVKLVAKIMIATAVLVLVGMAVTSRIVQVDGATHKITWKATAGTDTGRTGRFDKTLAFRELHFDGQSFTAETIRDEGFRTTFAGRKIGNSIKGTWVERKWVFQVRHRGSFVFDGGEIHDGRVVELDGTLTDLFGQSVEVTIRPI
ncbi:MAG TPA: hypothetical protein VJJ02_02900 [Candidatus Paceibacterota bacterium]